MNIESILLVVHQRGTHSLDSLQESIYTFKKTTSLIRGVRPDVKIALTSVPNPVASGAGDFTLEKAAALLTDSTLAENVDALAISTSAIPEISEYPLPKNVELWLEEPPSEERKIPLPLVDALRLLADTSATRFFFFADVSEKSFAVLRRLQAYFSDGVSRDPQHSTKQNEAHFFDARRLTPLIFLCQGELSREGRLELSGGPFREAHVENLLTGARRTFPLKPDSKFLDLDLSKGPLAVRLIPAETPGQTQERVTVAGEHHLTADEIVARERAWQAVVNDHVKSYTADLETSLRFRVAEINETFDLTIKGPLFKERGKDFDWAWNEFFVNGVKWKGATLPKIPILQPEKVTTLPLEIELTEDYDYTLAARSKLEGRDVYEIDFAPKAAAGDKPLYKGRAWIDEKTFALLKRRSIQVNLKGETLSNVETEFYKPAPSDPKAVLPLEIKGEEVFSTAGRTTAVERAVVMKHVQVNPAEFQKKKDEIYGSEKQMVRDTDRGLKYLVPDPSNPGERVVEEYVSKKSLFGAAGFFYDPSLSYPVPLLGIQYFNFDLFRTGKQVSVFFGGVLLTGNYTDPSFLGTRFDVGADIFGVAIPFGDTDYQDGREVKSERLKHVPAQFQLNIGHPLGPYLKASVGLFTKYDDYQRDKDTESDFVTPVDTETFGASGKLTANIEGFNAAVEYTRFHRSHWPFWGIPGESEYHPSQRDYEKASVSLSKDYYFSGFRKLHAGITYLDGSNLDRFSRYEFGAFSGSPLRGYQSGALRTAQAWVMNLSYGLNIENIIRLEGVYDQAVVNDSVSGFSHDYFSGAGISGQLNGPWNNSLLRFDVGTPVVSHGIHGVTASALILKLF